MADTTKASLYLSALFVIAIFSAMIVNVSIASVDEANLDSDSLLFVSLYSNVYYSSNLTQLSDTQLAEIIEYDIGTPANESGEIVSTDQFSIPKYTEASLTSTTNFFKLIYNLPTIMLVGVGFKSGVEFVHYINIFSYIIYISLAIMVIKMFMNGGNT